MAPLRHSLRTIHEPDGFDDAVSGISLRVEFKRRQEKPSTVEQFQSPEWALDFGETGVATRVSGVLRGGWASLCFSLGPGSANWNGREAPMGTLALLPPGAELGGRTAAGFSWVTAAIPPAAWQRCLALAGLDEGPRHLETCGLLPAEGARVRRCLMGNRARLGGAEGPDLRGAIDGAAADLIEAFTLAVEAAASRELPAVSAWNRTRLAHRAETWMRGHLGDSCRVPELCLALGVSRRELEYAFRMVFDQSPRERLETLRLHAIRRALRTVDRDHGTVTRIALEHGVSHLGRFAASYWALFGENPAETRKRRA